jgi:uncharacterized coiled-coil protein SlyX
MGKVTIGSGNLEDNKTLELTEAPLIVREVVYAPPPLQDHRIVILEECQDELFDNVTRQEFDLINMQDQLRDLEEQIQNVKIMAFEKEPEPVSIQSITNNVKYDDTEMRALIQGLMEALDQVQKGQEFVNARFRQDINNLRTESHPVSEIIRVHERLPKWVSYGFIFNFILALLGLLT